MNDWNSNANEIFLAAAEIHDPDERARYVASQCGEDHVLQRAVESLISADRQAGDFLERNSSPDVTLPPLRETEPGSVVGPYKLLQKIGEGGFGVVYMAEQRQPVRRRVALKIIKPGMDTKQVIARFEAERQALAMMEHPNIAKVLDAGRTETGRPYFVMELVRGVSITEFCDANSLSIQRRLELFIPVCQAIQHAHQISISPESNLLATGSRDNTIKLWDPKRIVLLKTLKGHSGVVDSVLFSPHGDTLASASQDYSVVLWDVQMLREPNYIPFSRLGNRFAVVAGKASRIEADTIGSRLRTISVPTDLQGRTTGTAVAGGDGTLAVTLQRAGKKRSVQIWRSETFITEFVPGKSQTVRSFAFHPNNTSLVLSIANSHTPNSHELLLWNIGEPNAVPKPLSSNHEVPPRAIAFSVDGKRMLTGDSSGRVCVWDCGTYMVLRTENEAHRDEVWALAFHPHKSDVFVTGSLSGRIRVWNMQGPEPQQTIDAHAAAVNDLLFSADCRTLFSAGGKGTIRVWDADTWEERAVLHGHYKYVIDLDWMNDNTLISKGYDGIRIWHAPRD